jgi:pimeloyl-ACP methyl ester carboxylesterase
MPSANIHGQSIYYEDSGGSGPPVILAHGFLMDQSLFDAQVAALAPAFRVIRWDARGFGKTVTDGRPFTYWDAAADTIGLLDHLGIERAVVGGMSQGGFASLRAALAHPDRVKALVLISTEAAAANAEDKAAYQQMFDMWIAAGPTEPLLAMIAGLILGPPEFWEPWVSQWREVPASRLLNPVRCLLDRDDVTARLPEITCPAIVIHGTADTAIPLARAELLCRSLPGCTGLVEVTGAAHAANLTHPEQANPPLLEFLRAHA